MYGLESSDGLKLLVTQDYQDGVSQDGVDALTATDSISRRDLRSVSARSRTGDWYCPSHVSSELESEVGIRSAGKLPLVRLSSLTSSVIEQWVTGAVVSQIMGWKMLTRIGSGSRIYRNLEVATEHSLAEGSDQRDVVRQVVA